MLLSKRESPDITKRGSPKKYDGVWWRGRGEMKNNMERRKENIFNDTTKKF